MPARVEAVFLDRDGVINENRADHVKSWSEFRFLPGAPESIRRLTRAGCKVFVISNQAMVNRGIVSHHVVDQVNGLMLSELDRLGARVEAVAYCPHRPEQDCPCRKPRPGLLLKLAARFGVDLRRAVVIGDALSDLEAGLAVGCKTILVLTGRGRDQLAHAHAAGLRDLIIAHDLVAATDLLVGNSASALRAGDHEGENVKALVTGGAGFIGSHITDALIHDGHRVVVVDNLVSGQRRNVHPRASFYGADIGSGEFRAIVQRERPKVVFHQAAQMSVKRSTDDPVYDAQVNVLGLLNVLEACAASGVRKIVFASSGATYGNPDYLPLDETHPLRPASPYGITKMVAEHYLAYYALDRGLQYTALRYGNVYGPRQDAHGEAGVVAIFTTQLLAGRSPTIHWDGEQVRDYVYVGDVARANVLAATAGDNRTYCIGTGVGTSVNRLYSELCNVLGVHVQPNRAARRSGDLRAAYFDAGRAERDLGWQARVSLRAGLALTVEAFRSQLLAVA